MRGSAAVSARREGSGRLTLLLPRKPTFDKNDGRSWSFSVYLGALCEHHAPGKPMQGDYWSKAIMAR